MLGSMGIADRRTEYETAGLDLADLDPDPIVQWQRWYAEAVEAGCTEPNAMVLATVGADGQPDARFVLVRGADERGFTFFSNLGSAKARQLAANPRASLTFGWLELHRQVRIRGSAETDRTRRGRRLLRDPAAGEPDRLVGVVGAEPTAGRPGHARGSRRRRRRALRRHGGDPTPVLDRHPGRALRGRDVAGPPEPPARPLPLPPLVATAGRSSASGPDRRSELPGAGGVGEAVDERLGVRVEPGALPVPEQG